MRRGRLIFLSCAAATSIACGITADFSGLQGGSIDAGVPEVAESSDGSDAGFCARRAGTARLCVDFDQDAGFSEGFDFEDISSGQTARLDNVSYSPPGSFLSAVNQSGSPTSARLGLTLPITTTHVHAEFALLVQPSSGSYEVWALHEETAQGVTYGVFYKVDNKNLLLFVHALSADGGDSSFVRILGLAQPKWLNVEIDVDIGESGGVVIKHDGAPVLNESGLETLSHSVAKEFIDIGLYSGTGSAGRANFDNLLLDWR